MNKLFHSGYFKEIFRQLRVAGLVSAGVLMLNNATSAFSIVFGLLDDFTSIPGGMQLALPLMEYAYIMGLVLTFIAFGWMNKRSAADFYHCIPITRKQIYFSSVAAILLWMFIGMTAYAIVHALIYLVCGAPFNYLLYLGVYLTMLIGAVEVVGATAIACSISGTRFVNLIAAVVILFIPRFLLTVMSGFVMIKDSTIVSAFITPLFDPNYNVIATPYSIFTSDLLKVSVTFGNPLAMLWNLVYALILIVLGAVAFQKRKSEMAGVPTGRGFQAVIRTAVGVPLLLVLDLIVIGRDSSRIFDFGSAADLVLPMVVLLILSFVFYSLYELISTKSAKKMVKAMPLFVICLAIGALYLVLPGLICKAENSIKLDASNIKSYSVYSEEGDGLLESLLGGSYSKSYSELVRSDLNFTDDKGKQAISEAYARTVKEGASSNVLISESSSWNDLTVRIDRKFGHPIVRTMRFTVGQMSVLEEVFENDERYRTAETAFPDGRNYFSVSGFTNSESAEIAKLFREEYSALSEGEKLSLYSGLPSYFYGDYNEVPVLQVLGCKGVKNYTASYALNSATPNAFRRYKEILNEKHSEKCMETVRAMLETANSDSTEMRYALSVYEPYYLNFDGYMMEWKANELGRGRSFRDTLPELVEAIEIISRAQLSSDPERSFVISTSDYNAGEIGRASVALSEADQARLAELSLIIAQNYQEYFSSLGGYYNDYSSDYDY